MSDQSSQGQEPHRSVEKNPTDQRQPVNKRSVDGRDEVPPAGENAEINDDRMERGDVDEATKTLRETGSSGHP